jgi:hypothetical protein
MIELLEEREEPRVAGLGGEPSEPAGDRRFVARGQRPDHNARPVSQNHPLDVRRRSGIADTIRDRR